MNPSDEATKQEQVQEVDRDLVVEFLSICLLMGGRFCADVQNPPDLMDEFLKTVPSIESVFDFSESEGLVVFKSEPIAAEHAFFEEEIGWYEITEAGKAFVETGGQS